MDGAIARMQELTTVLQLIPRAMREHMGMAQGQDVEFVAQPNGQVLMFVAKARVPDKNPFLKWVGVGVSGMTTEEILNFSSAHMPRSRDTL